MTKNKLARVKELLQEEKAVEARRIFRDIVPEETIDYHSVKGMLEQKFQNWGDAINAWNKVLELDPGNAEAEHNLHLIKNILNFWNPEMFNP